MREAGEVSGDRGYVSLARANEFTVAIVLGQPKPDDLTAAESEDWDAIAAEVAAHPDRAYGPAWEG
jgi:hypothetical protein